MFRFSGTCDSLCVSGVCTAKDKCTCDRGFDGTNCNDTAITGELVVKVKYWPKEKRARKQDATSFPLGASGTKGANYTLTEIAPRVPEYPIPH